MSLLAVTSAEKEVAVSCMSRNTIFLGGVVIAVLAILGGWRFVQRANYALPATTGVEDAVPNPALVGAFDAVGTSTREAITHADITALAGDPAPTALTIDAAADAQQAFDLAQKHFVFKRFSDAASYLTVILDSTNAAALPFKAAAAHLFLRAAYVEERDVEFLAASIAKSTYMSSLTPKARAVFPQAFATVPGALGEKDELLYLVSYYVALSDDLPDSVALPASAALELSRLYLAEGASQTDKVAYASRIHTVLARSVAGITAWRAESKAFSAYDMLVGMNTLAITTDLLQYYKASEFTEITDVDVLELLNVSQDLAFEKVPLLTQATSYLLALYTMRHAGVQDVSRDAYFEILVRRVVGKPPFEDVDEYSWATKYLTDTQSGSYSDPYSRENLAFIASQNATMHDFLLTKGGWTEADFKLASSTRP